jgi:hypothetical protein
MLLADRLTLDKPRRTADGYMAVRAKAARAGVYQYLGREIDPEGKKFAADQVVNVYRSEDEVFDAKSVASFLMKPITDEHPAEPVTADNWREHAKGVVGRALRDGEHLAFDLVLMDKGLIEAVESGKRELSNGYGLDIAFEEGTAPDGTAYQAVQRHIRGNHVAVVDKGRAGSTCRIGDAAACEPIPSAEVEKLVRDQRTYDLGDDDGTNPSERRETSNSDGGPMATKMITFDGLPLEVTDAAEAAINRLLGQLKDAASAKEAVDTQVATLTTDKATLEAKVTTLEKQIEDAKVTPAQLRDAAKAYAAVVDKAKALGVAVTDEMDEPAIIKAAVTAKLGDATKDWTDAQFAASFATLTKDVKPADKLRDGIRDAAQPTDDTHKAYDAMVSDLENAWKPKQPATA